MASPTAVAMPPADLFGHDHSFMAVQEKSENKCDKEEDRVHDCKCPGGLEHGTVLVDVDCP